MNIIENNTVPQNEAKNVDRERMEKLYFLIRKRVKRTKFSRRLTNADEVANEIFIRLADQNLPEFVSEEFENLLRRTTGHVVRDFKLFSKALADIDEIDEDEHPFYEMDFFSEEKEFELIFEQFCESFPEPKRTVFAKSRHLTKENIAELTGLGRNTVAQMIKAMPDAFRFFLGERNNVERAI